MTGVVISVSRSGEHKFSKPSVPTIRLIAGLGVEGDAHAGKTMQHLSLVAKDPTQPNLRQVHLMHGELLDELNAGGFSVEPGDLAENITTRGIDLLGLPRGTKLHLGPEAVIEITGLRNPCFQFDDLQKGLLKAVLGRDGDGALVRKSGVMAVVITGGTVGSDDHIRIERPQGELQPLVPV